MRKGEPTPDEMYQAVVDAGEALREPGDNQSTIRHRIAREAGLSERTVRAYFHREARRNHAAHLALFEDLIDSIPAPTTKQTGTSTFNARYGEAIECFQMFAARSPNIR